MALYVDCDQCGEEIIGFYAVIETTGTHENDRPVGRRTFYYHPGERGDEGSCYRRALRMLEDVRAVGASREQAPDEFGLEWRLVREDQPRFDGADEDVPSAERVVPDPAWREKMLATPIDAFPALTHQHVDNLKRAGVRSLADVAGRSREELLDLPGVGVATAMTAGLFVDALCLRDVVRAGPEDSATVEKEA